jgi:hypothetical protein
MPTLLATINDLFVHGLPATAAVPPPRTIELVDIGSGRILTKGHGLVTGDQVKFEGQGTLPVPLVASTLYTVTVVDLDLFTVSVTGASVTLTDSGTKPFEWRIDPRPVYEKALLAASWDVQNHATAHGDLTEVTPQVVRIVCILAAYAIAFTNRLRLPITKEFLENLQRLHDDAWITLRAWEKGKPIAGIKDATPTIAEAAAIAGGPIGEPNGWGWGVGL